jgi:dTMP kinase
MSHLVFVVIDGLDGSGKSTQAILLSKFLANRGRSVLMRTHPSDDNFLGVEARRFLYSKGKSAHFASAIFYMLDIIRSIALYSWRKYDYIIFVRYLMGTAYLPSPLHTFAYRFFASIVPTSKFMYFLDVTPKEAYQRIQQAREKLEMFESLNELQRIRDKAFSLASIDNWTIIDANASEEKVQKTIRTSLISHFSNH